MAKKVKPVTGIKCNTCGVLWHSSQRKDGDECKNEIGKKICKGTCKQV
jgi:hypothetical protein